jgi:hypothetical protein
MLPPAMDEMFGYTEPVRRFIQRESWEPQANEIPNTMPSWMPGDDYYTNFRVGDPYIKVDQGFARLPGGGYEALHPELKDVDPEDYPDINKMAILADVAPYSREYNTYRLKVGKQAQDSTELQIEYEKILDRVRQTRSPHPGEQQKARAGAGDDRHIYQFGTPQYKSPELRDSLGCRSTTDRSQDRRYMCFPIES